MEQSRQYFVNQESKLSKTQEMKRRRRKYPNVFFKKNIVAVFEQIDNPKTMVAAFLAFFCALRISEVCKLRWRDIDLSEKRLKVVDGKNHKDGFIPLSSLCIPVLKKWQQMHPNTEFLLPSDRYDLPHYRPNSLLKDFKKALKKAGLLINTETTAAGHWQHQYKFHTLRHSRCTHLLSNGVPLQQVQKFMRHDEIDTTMTYTWILDSELNRMVEDVDNASKRNVQMSQLQANNQVIIEKKEEPLDIARKRLAYGEITLREYKKIEHALVGI